MPPCGGGERLPETVRVTACMRWSVDKKRLPWFCTGSRARPQQPRQSHRSQMIPRSRISAMRVGGHWSTSARTVSVCSPSRGGGRSRHTGVLSNLSGWRRVPGLLAKDGTSDRPLHERPPAGRQKTSSSRLIAPHGTVAASRLESQSDLDRCLITASSIGIKTSRFRTRSAFRAKRGSAARCEHPATPQKRANWPSLPTARIR
jgi:hypothetical protein